MLDDISTKALKVIAFILFSSGLLFLNFEVGQSDFNHIWSSHFVAMAGYGYLVYLIYKQKLSLRVGIALGVLIRIVLLFAFPQLSDDIYRFLWDGHLIHEGISPLEMLPSELINDPAYADNYLKGLYDQLNSKSYFTVYPPLSQLVFYLSTMSSTWSPEYSAIIMKLIFLIGEGLGMLALIKILASLGKPRVWALVYFLNPLLITETAGQLHFEGLMVMFLGLALWSLVAQRFFLSGCLMAGAIGVKLLPLMFLPLVGKFLLRKGVLPFGLGLVLTSVVLFVPFFLSLDIPHFLDSLNLYFQSFEYNASVYFVLRKIGFWIYGYNQIAFIGPALGLITLGYILYLSYRLPYENEVRGIEPLLRACFCAFACYLFLATTVHPWYLIMLLFFSTFLGRVWVLVWSGVVVLSYATYTSPDFLQNYKLISVEYLIVAAVLIFSVWASSRRNSNGQKKA